MGVTTSTAATVPFRNAKRFLSDLDAETAGRIIASAADIALILDNGVIKDIALGSEDLSREGCETWRGRRWVETVTVESRPKIEDLLKGDGQSAHWRQVNHPSPQGLDIPVRYTAVHAAEDRVIALGRDLRTVAAMQQRLMEAQQELERDYARLRQAESRYQLLFQTISEPVFIIDASTLEIDEVNPAGAELVNRSASSLVGEPFAEIFEKSARRPVEIGLATAIAAGRADEIVARLSRGAECAVLASAFRHGGQTRLVARLVVDRVSASPESAAHFLGILETLPDGLVATGPDLRILAANKSFLELTQLAAERQALGELVSRFVGRSSTDFNVLVSNLKSHGAVRNFATVLRDRFGATEDIEISAVLVPPGESAAYGFAIRSVARRPKTGVKIGEELPASVDQLTGLVGRVALKDIVRESTDLIERLCIEAALEMTGDNRASAAEMLGLSRQGLYSKLKRFGLGEG